MGQRAAARVAQTQSRRTRLWPADVETWRVEARAGGTEEGGRKQPQPGPGCIAPGSPRGSAVAVQPRTPATPLRTPVPHTPLPRLPALGTPPAALSLAPSYPRPTPAPSNRDPAPFEVESPPAPDTPSWGWATGCPKSLVRLQGRPWEDRRTSVCFDWSPHSS